MAIIADIVHHGAVYRDIYISPHSINSDSFYTLKYLVGGKNGPPLLGIEMTMRSMTFNNSRAGLSKPDGAGIAYDRNVGAWPQVYADLKAKIAAGVVPWITNVRDEDEVAPTPLPDVPEETLLADYGEVGVLEPEPVVEAEFENEPLDLNTVPAVLARFVEADETASEFRIRLKSLWQRFGIEDGKHFPGGGEALDGDEKILMGDLMGVMNAHLFAWMKPNE
jgi:hypothetical protein